MEPSRADHSGELGSGVRVLRQDSVSTTMADRGFKLELFHDESKGLPQPLLTAALRVREVVEEEGRGCAMVTVSYNTKRRPDVRARVDRACRCRPNGFPGSRVRRKSYKPEPKEENASARVPSKAKRYAA